MTPPLKVPPPRVLPGSRETVAAALVTIRAHTALADLVRLLDLHGFSSRWSTAGAVASRLAHFETSPEYRAIRAGVRAPRSTLERLLSTILDCRTFPRSRRRIFELL